MPNQIRSWFGTLLVVVVLPGATLLGARETAGQTTDVRSASESANALVSSIESFVAGAVASDPDLRGASVRLLAPRLGIDKKIAVGVADEDQDVLFTTEHPIRISSVTKTFVAAAIFRLIEEGEISLADPISRHLPSSQTDQLHQAGYDAEAITVGQLLGHASGLRDVFYTVEWREYMDALRQGGKTRAFTLQDMIDIAMRGVGEAGGPRPTGAPGQRQAYTDTGYILLGSILQQQTGKNMAEAVRTLTGMDSLELKNTWWEHYEPAPKGSLPRARQYYGDIEGDLLGMPPFDLHGGGGMVSSNDDLVRFFLALLNGEIFEEEATLTRMKSKIATTEPHDGKSYDLRYGLIAAQIEGETTYGHSGWWGVTVQYAPDSDILVVTNWLQQQNKVQVVKKSNEFMAGLIRLQRELAPN